MKVIEKVAANLNRVVFSFEFFPSESGCLFAKIDRLVLHNPLFCAITWEAGGSKASVALEIANKMHNILGVETMMHLACAGMPVDKIDHYLEAIKSIGLHNVLALRGDHPPTGLEGGFTCARDLVKHIRVKYGDHFGITVAGYPEAHPDVIGSDEVATPDDYKKVLTYLKSKVDAGADLIVTQFFYDTDIFLKFESECRQIGITCPIVPGIMHINNYKGFIRMTELAKTKIPAKIMDDLDPIKDNEEAVKSYGIHLGTEMCRKITEHGCKALHLYTINMEESALAILKNLTRLHMNTFPANRPKSYISRTIGHNQNLFGRCGDARNRSRGELTDYQFMWPSLRDKKLIEEWAVPLISIEDIYERFRLHCMGRLKSCPWTELGGFQPEIVSELVEINKKGFLVINSLPSVNGQKSDSPTIGWGEPGGYVYQKAYLEFFCWVKKLDALVEKINGRPSMTIMASNQEGKWRSNMEKSDENAVTWVVLPGKRILQPTVVTPANFDVWKDQAFKIWSRGWGHLYPEGDLSRNLIAEVAAGKLLLDKLGGE